MKDRVYMVLAFIGFIIIAVVCILNYDGSQELKEFGPGTYYTPQARYGMTSSSSIYAQMTDRKTIACPITTLSSPSKSPIALNGVAGSNHPYQITNMFFTWEDVGVSRTTLSRQNVFKTLWPNDSSIATGSGQITFGDLCPSAFNTDKDFVEIVAPFSFTYENLNTNVENGQDIVIINTGGSKRGKCRITFSGVANWFCAGEPGTTQIVSSGKKDNEAQWIDHYKYHQTIIGNSKNAEINGGSGGVLLGYASPSTTVTIEVRKSESGGGISGWQTISISDWIQGK